MPILSPPIALGQFNYENLRKSSDSNLLDEATTSLAKLSLATASKFGCISPPLKRWCDNQSTKYTEQLRLNTSEFGDETEQEVMAQFKNQSGKPLSRRTLKLAADQSKSTHERLCAIESAKVKVSNLASQVLIVIKGTHGLHPLLDQARSGNPKADALLKCLVESVIRSKILGDQQNQANDINALSETIISQLSNPDQWVTNQLQLANKVLCNKQSLSTEMLGSLNSLYTAFELRQFTRDGNFISEENKPVFMADQLFSELKEENAKHANLPVWEKNLSRHFNCRLDGPAKSIALANDKVLQYNLKNCGLV